MIHLYTFLNGPSKFHIEIKNTLQIWGAGVKKIRLPPFLFPDVPAVALTMGLLNIQPVIQNRIPSSW
jgi:hypothetical protein